MTKQQPPDKAPTRKWKDKLLSSSFPLEFECSNLFGKQGFFIDPEYVYSRVAEGGVPKEFSVDFIARAYPMFDDPNDVRATLEVPVECKYRTRNKRWIFLPEPEDECSLLAHGIRLIDGFSAYAIENKAIREWNCSLSVAYKGVEVHMDSGDVHEADLKHGVNQLKYALPNVIAQHLLDSVSSHPTDNQPLMLFPVLVTTASLWMLNRDASVAKFEIARDLDELAFELPYLAIRTGSGVDFEKHVGTAFKEFREIEQLDRHHVLARRSQAKRSSSNYDDPIAMAKHLANGSGNSSWFGSFVICNFTHLEKLIREVKNAVEHDLQNIKLAYPAMHD